MSWGTCYAGSNNIYPDFPPIMHDGRNYANWQPGSVINDRIRQEAKIQSNWEYRRYLSNNADAIIKFNQLSACDDCGANTAQYGEAQQAQAQAQQQGKPSENNTPYLFKSTMDTTQKHGYENSDLKNIYLSDVTLQARMVNPVFSQADLLGQGFPRAN